MRTVGDLAALGETTLVAAVGDARGRHLHALAHNIDDRAVEPDHAVKSIGHEETFAVDHQDREVLTREVVRLADRTAGRLRAAKQRGRTVQLKIRYADFRTITRSRTLPAPTDLASEIADHGAGLARRGRGGRRDPAARCVDAAARAAVDGPGDQTALDFGDRSDDRPAIRRGRRPMTKVSGGVPIAEPRSSSRSTTCGSGTATTAWFRLELWLLRPRTSVHRPTCGCAVGDQPASDQAN